MANIIADVENKIELGAEAALKFVSGADKLVVDKSPAAIAALGVVFGKVDVLLGDTAALAASPAAGLNIELDASTLADLKAVWPAVIAFLATLGIKL